STQMSSTALNYRQVRQGLRPLTLLFAAITLCFGVGHYFEPIGWADSQTVSQYKRNQNKDRVIVFVHGIFGNAVDTWTCPKGAYWPTLLSNDRAFDNSDIYVVAYDTPRYGNRMTIDEVVSNLKNRLEYDKVFQ